MSTDVGRYLLRELLYQLERSGVDVPGLTDVNSEELEVLSFSGYDDLRLRSGSQTYDARLDWSLRTAPVVTGIEDDVRRS
jgi:hypothetical protein